MSGGVAKARDFARVRANLAMTGGSLETMSRYSILGALSILLVGLAACSFRPQVGMSFDDWNRQCRTKTLAGGTLLRQEGAKSIYYCNTEENLYTFENGVLAEIKNQPAYGAGAGVKLMH